MCIKRHLNNVVLIILVLSIVLSLFAGLSFSSHALAQDSMSVMNSIFSDVEEFKATVALGLENCDEYIDISSFSVSADDTVKTAVSDYIRYYMPEYFHVTGVSFVRVSAQYVKLKIAYDERYNTVAKYRAARSIFDAEINKLLDGVKGNSALNEEQKALVMHDRLITYLQYDMGAYTNSVDEDSYNMCGVVFKQTAVCNGYCMAYYYLLSQLGIRCEVVNSNLMMHAWNIAYIDGVPYYVDCTWDDPTYSFEGYCKHENFLRSLEGIKKTGHNASDYQTDLAVNSTKYDDYYWQNSYTAFQLIDNELYYIDNENTALKKASTGEVLCSVYERWMPDDSHYYFENYAKLCSDGTALFFNLTDSVYKYSLKTGAVSKLFTPDVSRFGEYYSIYGLHYADGVFDCQFFNNANYNYNTAPQYVVSVPYVDKLQVTVTFESAQGSVSGAGEYEENETAVLVAAAKPGYLFKGFYRGGQPVSHAATYSFVVTQETALTALFEACTHPTNSKAYTTVEAGCVEGGYTLMHCNDCGYEERQNPTPALGHNWGSWVLTRESTCTEKGYKEKSCSVCHEIFTEDIPELNHDYTAEIIVPTCTAKGYTKHTCSRCGDTYNDTETEMIAHTVVTDTAVEPTCRNTGLTEGSHCSVCGYVIVEQTVIPLTNHRYETTNIASTCVQKGFSLHTCVWCGDAFKSDFSDTGEHSYIETITTPATCSKEGVKTFTCTICGDKYTRSIDTIEHTPQTDAAVAPTCTKAGLAEGSHCAVCGYVIEEQAVVPATRHSCTAAITNPTCKDKGYTTHTCTVCGDSYVDSYTDVTDAHDYKAVTTKPATCTQTGTKTFTCTVCGDKYNETIPMISHTVETDKALASTCTKAGLTEGSHCSVCGKVLTSQTTVAAKGHQYNSAVTKDSTCAQTGIKTFTCSVCGDSYTESIALKSHTIVTDQAVAPTCTKYGLSGGKYCSTCGKIFETQERIDPLGHDFGSVVTPAILTANGVITHPCSRCDKADESEVIYAPKTFALAKTSFVYSGKAFSPAVTVTDSNGNVLTEGTDYSVKYQNNKSIGTASVVITFTGNYEGTKTLTFSILPKGTTLKLTAAKKAFTAKWIKVSGVTGYQLQYSTNAKFTGAKTVNVKGASKASQAIKNLKGGAKYYVRIRTYKTIGGKNYYSTWSAAKAVTTKR